MSGWKRIGIIASVVWILAAGIYTYKGMENYAALTHTPSVALKAAALISLTTAAIGWGLAYLILFLVNWVRRGFASPTQK